METNQTTRVLELLKRFNNGEKVCIDKIIEEAQADADDYIPNIWLNNKNKPVADKTIRRALDVIKEQFPESFELVRGAKGEKGYYKAITNKAFNNFINKEVLSLMVQTFNLANKSNLFNNFDLDDSDKKILESKIKETNKLYEFKNKPLETKKDDIVNIKALEYAIKYRKCTIIEYPVDNMIKKLEVKPYKIIFINGNFYIACEIETIQLQFAMYRISKIEKVIDTPNQFNKEAEIIDFISDIQTPFPKYRSNYKKYLIDVVIEIDREKAYHFENKKHFKSQEIIETKTNGNIIVHFKVTQEKEVDNFIKSWIPFVKVIKPLSLKNQIKSDLRKYLDTL